MFCFQGTTVLELYLSIVPLSCVKKVEVILVKGSPPRIVIEEYVKGKESIGQDDIEYLAKICFLALEDAEVCAEHRLYGYMSKKKTSATEKAKKDKKKSRPQELSSRWSGGKSLLYLQMRGRRLHDTVQ